MSKYINQNSLPWITAGLQGGLTTLQISAQNQQAVAEAQAARNAAISDYNQMQLKQQQDNQQSVLEMMERQKQGMVERSKINNALATAGVSGNSATAEMGSSYSDQAWDTGIMKQNLENTTLQNQATINNIYTNQASRINAANAKIMNPYLALLQIGANAFSGYSSGYQMSKDIQATKKKG
jgi:hypothetical protein